MFVWNTAYVFVDNYLSSQYQIGTVGTSGAMFVCGVTLMLSSTVLVSTLQGKYTKQRIVAGAAIVMILANVGIITTQAPLLVYVSLIPLAAGFAVGFSTLLSLYSASVDSSEQGWVMGVSTALWTAGAGISALIGGDLMSLNLRLPFFIAIASAYSP